MSQNQRPEILKYLGYDPLLVSHELQSVLNIPSLLVFTLLQFYSQLPKSESVSPQQKSSTDSSEVTEAAKSDDKKEQIEETSKEPDSPKTTAPEDKPKDVSGLFADSSDDFAFALSRNSFLHFYC